MPSPFPGMDPWLEDPETFPGLHQALSVYIAEALNSVLPNGYVARIRELVWVDDEQRREPDVSTLGPAAPPGGSGATATLPGLLALGDDRASDPTEQPYLEILSPKGKRLVTAVEILSRSNKRPGDPGRAAYQEKQEEFRLGGVNLVEIDLLRAGMHTTAVPLDRLRRAAVAFDYHVSVRVAGYPGRLHAAPLTLADRLPTIGIPLDHGVPPVTVDLQPLLDRAYDAGRYAADVRYDRPPDPPLTPEQRAWADDLLRRKGVLP